MYAIRHLPYIPLPVYYSLPLFSHPQQLLPPFRYYTFGDYTWAAADKRRLASVNFFLGLVGVVQVSRIFMYNTSQKKLTSGQQIEAAKDSAVESAAGLKQDAIEAVKS